MTRLLPLFGFLFLTAYIRSAAMNVVYTDYIRLVNSYLENVWSPAPYLQADIFTRIPINYPERIINVALFGYSTMFDMMLGAAGLAISALIAALYCERKNVSVGTTLVILFVMFSLNKWEMLTNGSGWAHFAAFALFWYHYLVYDRVLSGRPERGDGKKLLILPWITILLFAGPYCAVYAAVLLTADGFLILTGNVEKKAAAKRMLCALLPFLLYMVSRVCSVEERAGATTEPVSVVAAAHPLLLPRLFLRSFASEIIGGETAEHLGAAGWVLTAIGVFVLLLYLLCFYLQFRRKYYLETTFPLLLLTAGFMNHLLITASRWIFLNENYGMSSRYALQFQVGTVGILLTLSLHAAKQMGSRKKLHRYLSTTICLIFCIGTFLTNSREIHMAPYRQEAFAVMRDTALSFETESDATLKQVLQYHDPQRTRKALTLLKERGLNIYE